ncbi:MAG: SH3 domain-containing protein [Candidatus Limiplasma sp.]|nr:SH3 domain-containing protein [Candidatus Limiplasma sp.]
MRHGKATRVWKNIISFIVTLVLLSGSSNGSIAFFSQAMASSTAGVNSNLLDGINLGDDDVQNVEPPYADTATTLPAVVTPAPQTDADALPTDSTASVPETTVQPEATMSVNPETEPTETVASDTATTPPQDELLTLQNIIQSTNHAYMVTADRESGLYSGYGMSKSQRIGTLNGRGSLLFATDYVLCDGLSAAVLVWFDTDHGVISGYISEDRLNPEPMNAAQALEFIGQNGLMTSDFVLDELHYMIAKVAYAPQAETDEGTTAAESPVLYQATVTTAPDGVASLYETADQDSAVCATLQVGETVSVLGETDGWAYVLAADGDRGYLPSTFIVPLGTQTESPATEPTIEPASDEGTPSPTEASSLDQMEGSETLLPESATPSEAPILDLTVEPEPSAEASQSATPTDSPETVAEETVTLGITETPAPTAGSSLDELNNEDIEPSVSPEVEPSVSPDVTDAELNPSESLEPSATPEATVSPSPLSELPAAVAYAVVTLPSGTTPLYAEANPVAAIIDQLADGTYVGVLAVDNDWAHVYVRKGEGFLEGYLANNILTLSALSTGEPIPTPAPVVFIPMQPKGLPGYYLSIGTAEFDTSSAPAGDAAPTGESAPVTDTPQDADLLSRLSQLFFASASAEEAGTASTDIYTFIGADGVQYYRVYGIVNGVEGYYACDENGTLLEPYQLVDIAAEQETLTNDTPSISTRGLVNFALSSSATPTTIPAYYTSFPAGENTTVYTFVGRDGVTYYRIYGTNTSGVTGFFACDQYGENESATPIVLNDEFNTIAPYVYASLAAPSMPTGLTLASSNPYLYSYPAADGTTQYRMYGVKLNDPTDTDKHWYATDAAGKVTEPLLKDDIQLDINNLWANGFIEAANPAAAIAPSFYGLVGGVDNTDTIKARKAMWAYTDRTGVVRYRVYGTVNGVAGFYECDTDGNVLSLTPVDLVNEQLYLSPLVNGIADEYIPGYAKVVSTNVTSITDGTPVWDATTSAVSTGTLGNDSSPNNLVVRSFDQVAYGLDFVTELNTSLPDGTDISNYKGFNNAKAYMRFEVPVTTENDVSFVMSDMGWLQDGKATYDAANKKWILTGYRQLTNDGGNIALPNRGTMNVIMHVNGAANAQTITPSASVWLDQGTDTSGNNLNATYTPTTAETTTGFQTVRVTAAPKYNVGIKYAEWNSQLRTPNFTTGDLDTGTQNYWVDTLAFVTEIRNDSQEKGLKGIEFSKGNFSFDVTVEAGLAGYDVSLWDYCDNTVEATSRETTGELGRKMMKGTYAYTPVDSEGQDASTRNTTRRIYDGGSFTVTEQTVSATKKILHVTVKDYKIDGVFPTKAGDDTFGVTYGANEGVFSVGNIEVLIKANTVTTTTTVPMTATVSNLSATSASGVATTTDTYSADNTTTPSFTLYPPGNLSKAIFMVSDSTPTTTLYDEAYSKMRRGEYARSLASSYWGYLTDPSVKVGAYDLMTKFDAKGFTPTSAYAGKYGEYVNIFFGALPSGANWTSDTQLENTRQEALDWYPSLDAMGGKKCVAVLFEYRGEGTFLPSNIINVWDNTMGYVPETATVNKVYEAVNDLKYWTNSTAAAMTEEVNTIMNNKGAANPPPAGVQFTNNTAIPGVLTNPYEKRTYNMDTYETTGGHTGGYIWGTSWLVIADFVQIQKTTAQSADNTVGGTAKSVYNLNNGERRVDYAITPTYTTGGLVPGTIPGTVTIVDTLPKYLITCLAAAIRAVPMCRAAAARAVTTQAARRLSRQYPSTAPPE